MSVRTVAAALAIVGIAIAVAWSGRPRLVSYDWDLPAGFPLPPVPADNPMSAAKIELGRHLFYDRRLSVNGTTACADCHLQALAFTDGRAVAVGATGEATPRSAMSLVNVAYNTTFDWANPNVRSLETQMLTPLFGEDPIEMGLTGHSERALDDLRTEPRYRRLFAAAWPGRKDPVDWPAVTQSIASFVRSIISADAPYDRYIRGDSAALDESELHGLELFLSERLECFHCHGGFNFSDSSTHDQVNDPPRQFHNTGLYDIDGNGGYPAPNRGLYELTGKPADMGRFRAPSLRNIALTAPYMHDGSIASLDAVIDHYASGGRAVDIAIQPDVNRTAPALRSEFVRGFELSADERRDLTRFLEALTDTGLTTDPRFSNPWADDGQP